MTAKIRLSAELARDLLDATLGSTQEGWTVIARQRGDDGKWAANYQLVIRNARFQHYAAYYQLPLGESNVPTPWEYDDEAVFEEVKPTSQAVVRYVTPDEAKPDTVAINGEIYKVGEWDHRGENGAGDIEFHLYATPAASK